MHVFKKFILLLILITFVFNTSFVFADYEKPNALEKSLGWMLRKFGDAGHAIIDKYGFSIDSLIYNEEIVVDDGSEVVFKNSPFVVDFSDGTENTFGKLGLVLNTIFSSFAIVLMFSVLIALGSRLQMNTITRYKVTFSETLSNYILGLALIYWLPEILTLFMYLSNFFVSAFNPSSAFGTGYIDTLKTAAADPNNPYLLWDSMIYLASVLINIYFVFVYGSRALYIAVFFGFFPLMVLYMNNSKLRQNFNNYVSTLFSTISIQWYDAAIFFALTYVFNAFGADPNMTFIKFIIMSSIIPLRALLKSFFSLSGRSNLSDMLGFAGLMGTVGLARGLVGGARNVTTGVYSGINDIRQAKKLKNDYGKWENSTVATDNNVNDSHVPYISTAPGFSSYAFEKNYSSNDGISFKQKMSPNDVYRHMMRKGSIGIGKSLGKGLGGATLGFVGATAGSGFGVTGMVYGAHLGGIIGSGVGEGLGAIGGLTGLYGLDGSVGFAKLMKSTMQEQSGDSVQQNTGIDIYKGAGKLDMVNNVNYTDGSNISYDLDNTTLLSGNSTFDGRAALGSGDYSDIEWDKEYSRHISNMSKEKYENIMKDADDYADRMLGHVDTSNMSDEVKQQYRDYLRKLYTVSSGYHYVLEEMKNEGIYKLDYTKLHMAVDTKMKNLESIIYMHMRYNADSVDINEL